MSKQWDGSELDLAVFVATGAPQRIIAIEHVGSIISDVFASPCLVADGGDLVLGHYGADRRLTISRIRPDAAATDAESITLEVRVGYDSHADIVAATDKGGRIHVCAAMHANALVYFRSADPANPVGSLTRQPQMAAAALEQRITYPRFFRGPDAQLWLAFRDGESGDGNLELYRWDERLQQWERPAPTPIVAREGMSPYIDSYRPILGPDGRYHLLWVWRSSPDAESNQLLCYAWSDDLLEWHDARGDAVPTPLDASEQLVVDPAGPGEGLLNNNCRLLFVGGSPVAVYHKYVSPGVLSLWVATLTAGVWSRAAVPGWSVEWEFGGRGTLDFKLQVGATANGVDAGAANVAVLGPSGPVELVIDASLTPQLQQPAARSHAVGPVAEPQAGQDPRRWWCVPATGDRSRGLLWKALPPMRDKVPDQSLRESSTALYLVRFEES